MQDDQNRQRGSMPGDVTAAGFPPGKGSTTLVLSD